MPRKKKSAPDPNKRKPGRPLKRGSGGKLIGTYVHEDKLKDLEAICIRAKINRTQFINEAIGNEIQRYRENE